VRVPQGSAKWLSHLQPLKHSVALTVQIYLSINRPDLAKKEYEKSKKWAEDDLLLQLIESTINLVTGKEGYSDCNSFYTEQLANPSLSSTRLLTARGVTRLLRGEITEAKSDLEEALGQGGADDETVAAYAVATTLRPSKKGEGDEWWRYASFPESPPGPWLTRALKQTDARVPGPSFSEGRFGEI